MSYSKLINPNMLLIESSVSAKFFHVCKDQINEKLVEVGWPQINTVEETGCGLIINLVHE